MEKKRYIKPLCTVYPIKPYQLLAGSPGPSISQTPDCFLQASHRVSHSDRYASMTAGRFFCVT